jgi:hypothetical protein
LAFSIFLRFPKIVDAFSTGRACTKDGHELAGGLSAGEGEGRYGAAKMAALATATEGDSAMGQIYGSVPARRGFKAANAALNVFNSFSTGVNVCVLSNGVLLDRQ